MSQPVIDIHCHPQLKPYGQSFSNNPAGQNNIDPTATNSIWHPDAPTLAEKIQHDLAGLPRFRESDFTTLTRGNVQVVCTALYPIEKGFFQNRLGGGTIGDAANDFITCVGTDRVDFVENNLNYFGDLNNEYSYYLQINGQPVTIDGNQVTYILVSNFADLDARIKAVTDAPGTIYVIMAIEGMHSLNSNNSAPPDQASVLANVSELKKWAYVPMYVTFAHHFYNYLCGHSQSLIGIVGWACDQSEGMNTGFTDLGTTVIKALLDNTNGKRIYIDIKHMSAQARKTYFNLLETDYKDEHIPVIISHGACNGLRSVDQPLVDLPGTGNKMFSEDINMYDNEILKVVETKGIFGLQLDKHRIADAQTLQSNPLGKITDPKSVFAGMVWNQVQHILELCDKNNLPAWDCITIGSDFDGIINPMNGYLTADTLNDLAQNLLGYATDYMNANGTNLQPINQVAPAELINRIFYTNAYNFMSKWFI